MPRLLIRTASEVLDYGDILVTKGQLDKNFEDWAYDENRTDGELDIIYSPDFGYFVIGYIRTEKQISGLLTDIAMKELTNIALEEAFRLLQLLRQLRYRISN